MEPSKPSGALDAADDDLLASRAADGDLAAFTALMRRHGPAVRGYAVRLLGSASDADDVVQETFVTAWSQLSSLDNKAVVRSWLMRIASRKAFAHMKAHPRVDELDPAAISDSPDPAAEFEHERTKRDLAEALSALPKQQQQCWLLKEVGGYSYDEIAEHLGIPTSTVRGALARTRRYLIEQMGAWR